MPYHSAVGFYDIGMPPGDRVQARRDRRQRALAKRVHSSPTRAVLAWNYQMQDVRDRELAHHCFWNWRIHNSMNRLLGLEWAARLGGPLASRFGLHDRRWAGPWPLGVEVMNLSPMTIGARWIRDWGLLDKSSRTCVVRNFKP